MATLTNEQKLILRNSVIQSILSLQDACEELGIVQSRFNRGDLVFASSAFLLEQLDRLLKLLGMEDFEESRNEVKKGA